MQFKTLIAACALTIAAASSGAAEAQRERRAAKAERVPVTVPEPPAGMGQVVFFRPSGRGFIIGCTVRENGTAISSLGNGRYFIHATTPGPHSYTARSEASDTVNVEVEPGETQFVRCSIGMGIVAGRPNLSPSDEAEFARRSPKLRMVRPRQPDGERQQPAGN
jgi:hypothetical protein